MYHNEKTPHLSKKQLKESKEYDVYHANVTIYFSQDAVDEETS
jgi:hypothetical protein